MRINPGALLFDAPAAEDPVATRDAPTGPSARMRPNDTRAPAHSARQPRQRPGRGCEAGLARYLGRLRRPLESIVLPS